MTVELAAPFDASQHITDEETQVELLSDALASGDRAYIAHALGVVARARGIADVAADTGLQRQALYRSLSKDGNPTLDTLLKVLSTLGLRLQLERSV